VASIRLEAQGSAGPWPIPRSRPPLRGLRHPATLTVVFVTEHLAAEHAALPVRGPRPGERRGTSVGSPIAVRKRATFAGS
jgi:hypothetical protein